MRLHSILPLLLITQLAACTEPDPEITPEVQLDILERLQAIPGMAAAEETSPIEGYRYFVMEYEQPADHQNPSGTRFSQRMLLLHRDEKAPFVLGTSGYGVNPSKPGLRETALLLQANQLWVEQRFFGPSRPDPADWSLLNIEQAANDHHRIVETLKPIYSGTWISAGASKGGMTSVYHRRFFPNDVDGTVAYVAPHSFGTSDARYIDFVASLGDEYCRSKLMDLQRELLIRREPLMQLMKDKALAEGETFDLLGEEKAFESAAIEFTFTYWQYFYAGQCIEIPNAGATDEQVWAFLDKICSPLFWADSSFLYYEPYYWQAATELGYPALDEQHLADLLKYPGLDMPTTYIVPGKTPTFKPEAMQDISNWLQAEGERFIFVYGAMDPYSAGMFDLGGAQDAERFVVPAQNHAAKLMDLKVELALPIAFEMLERWTGVTPVVPMAQPIEKHEPRWERW